MARESEDLWQSLARSGESLASEEDYEHGYSREVRQDLRRCIAFRCGDELYGLSISELAEITKPFVTTPVPRTAEFVIGVGNIRGNVLPVIDLARRLRLPARAATASTRVLIVRHGDELHGIVVDEVRDVVSIPPEAFEPPPGALPGTRAGFIAALARHGGEILILLDLAVLLAPGDFVRFEAGTRRP
ncbi:MAG: purine-binding chemotaxis protein CheW [Deltaproteobacteria bacterium]|nr:purine-binding chemotaxis protein CheW [Deltaproteobacteria bacterium]MBK8236465.1 purine-binding chemotaxis protein CheW [Deltaproteobacteria bacterium]MBP7288312.1 purine-binding chemotaxis protein CheW [Nannocystaceae bacterium]